MGPRVLVLTRGATEPIVFWLVFTTPLLSRGFLKPDQNCTLLTKNEVRLHLLKVFLKILSPAVFLLIILLWMHPLTLSL